MDRKSYSQVQSESRRTLSDAIKRFAQENPQRFAELQARALHELEHPPERSVISYPTLVATGRLDVDKVVLQFRGDRRDYFVHTTDQWKDTHLYFELLAPPYGKDEAIETLTLRHPKFVERAEVVTKMEPCACPLCQ